MDISLGRDYPLSTRSQVASLVWVLADGPKKAFSTVAMAICVPVLVAEAAKGSSVGAATAWGTITSLGVTFGLGLGILLGRAADRNGRLIPAATAAATMVGGITCGTYFLRDSLLVGGALIVAAIAGYRSCIVLHNFGLASATQGRNTSFVSGVSWGLGFALPAALLVGLGESFEDSGIGFVVATGCAVGFAVPLVAVAMLHTSSDTLCCSTRKQERHIFSEAKRMITDSWIGKPVGRRSLVSLGVPLAGINTLVLFVALFIKQETQSSTSEMAEALIEMLAVALISTIAGAFLARRLGPRLVMRLSLLIWVALCGGFALSSAENVLSMVVLAGIPIGVTKSMARALLLDAAPPEKKGSGFAMLEVWVACLGVLSVVVYTGATGLFGTQRAGAAAIGVQFLIALILALPNARRPNL